MTCRQLSIALVCFAALFTASGCGNKNVGRVTGVVTFEGEPVRGLEVEFSPVGEGRPSIGFTDQAGEYDLQYTLQDKGALVGKHVVSVSIPPGADLDFRIPAKYGGKSELTFEVAPGSNQFDIAMDSSR